MRTLLSLALFVVASSLANAEINIGITVEWLSHESSLIVEATPIDVENIKGPGDVQFTRTRYRLDEVIKGPLSAGDTVTVYDFSYNRVDILSLAKAKQNIQPILVFATAAQHSFKRIDGKYVLTMTRPLKSAYSRDKALTDLFTPDFRLVSTYDDLLRRARSQVKHEASLRDKYWDGTIVKKKLEVPFQTEAHRHLYAGSKCYLWVPEYKEREVSENSDPPDKK